jgi:hypothetical protein
MADTERSPVTKGCLQWLFIFDKQFYSVKVVAKKLIFASQLIYSINKLKNTYYGSE